MSDNLFHVARDGKTLGTFTLLALRDGLAAGKILPADHYWRNGMTDWKPVSDLSVEISRLNADLRIKAEAAAQAQLAAAQAEKERAAGAQAVPVALPQAASASAAPRGWECLSCKTGFSQPVEPISGYDTIKRAILLGAYAFGALFVGGGLSFALSSARLRVLAGFVAFSTLIAFLVLLFMFFFEFISSAVHHGIFRAGALKRCPGCSSNLIHKLS